MQLAFHVPVMCDPPTHPSIPTQPHCSIITSMFDDFMLLVGGQAAYAGPWGGAVDTFAAAG